MVFSQTMMVHKDKTNTSEPNDGNKNIILNKKMMEVHEDRLTGKEKFTNTVYSSSQLTSPHGPTPPSPRCAAKLSRLRRESSKRRPAPSSLVVPGGGREERRAGRRRTGRVGALSLFKCVFSILIGLSLHTVLENHHSLRENHDLFNTFYYSENSKLANQVVPRIEGGYRRFFLIVTCRVNHFEWFPSTFWSWFHCQVWLFFRPVWQHSPWALL